MRGVQIALAAAVLTSTLAAQQKVSPSFSALDEGAYAKLITAHKGRVVLVNFWATWCKPCRAEMPDLARLAEKLRGKGLDLVSISTDEPDREGEKLWGSAGACVLAGVCTDHFGIFSAVDRPSTDVLHV